MRHPFARGALLLVLLSLVVALHLWLAPLGYRWVAPLAGAALFLPIIGELLQRRFRSSQLSDQETRWERAALDPEKRRTAIEELSLEIDEFRRKGRREAAEHGRLCLLQAQLLQSDGRGEEAITLLSTVKLTGMERLRVSVIRHGRAAAYLHVGDAQGAAATLAALNGETDNRALDLSIRLLKGYLALMEGRRADAEAVAREGLEQAERGNSLHDDGLCLLALTVSDTNADESAQNLLAQITPDGVERIGRLGPAPARQLIAAENKT